MAASSEAAPLPEAPPFVAVVGPTASGKSALALALAERLAGEIVSCDSVQVYRGLDIGSGKATAAERARVPHHLLDVVAPDEAFDAAAWARAAGAAIDDIAARGRLPIVVGGTGFYYRALVRGLFDAPPPDPEIRRRHQDEAAAHGIEALHARLAGVDPGAARGIKPRDLVRISRALEVWEQTGVPISELWRRAAAVVPPRAIFAVRFELPLPELRRRIDARVDEMMSAGFLDEVRALHAGGYGATRALGSLGYLELGEHLAGTCSLADAIAAIKRNTADYARRQRTWFRREEAASTVVAAADPDRVTDAVIAWRNGLGARLAAPLR